MEPYINSIENSVDPDQLASEEASWSGSTLFSPQYVSLNMKNRIVLTFFKLVSGQVKRNF